MQRDFNDGLAQKEVMTNSIYPIGTNSRTAIICAVLSAFLSGCALPSPAMFEPGADERKFDRELYECERDARMIRGSDCDQMNLFESCMRSKGYLEIKGSAKKGMC